MTNEELLSVAEIVERATNRFNAQAALIASMKADHEAKMVEHRAAFGARTEADAKIIAGLRSEIDAARMAVLERDRLMSERDGLLTQVIRLVRDDVERAEVAKRLVAERDALRAEVAALQERLRASIARGDFAQMEVAALKSQNPKHPVKVGEWVRRLVPSPSYDVGTVAEVVHVDDDTSDIQYSVKLTAGRYGDWFAENCEPCDPPATHDTPEGRSVAESVIRDGRKTEPVADEIKVGDVVEVVSNTGLNTWLADVGSVGTVTSIETLEDSLSVRLKNVPDKKNACGGYVSICDVRKVTT